MRIVLDTNVLISALFKKESTSARILNLWRREVVELLVSPEGLAEIDRVLTYPKVRKRLVYSDNEVQDFLALLDRAGTLIQPDSITSLVQFGVTKSRKSFARSRSVTGGSAEEDPGKHPPGHGPG